MVAVLVGLVARDVWRPEIDVVRRTYRGDRYGDDGHGGDPDGGDFTLPPNRAGHDLIRVTLGTVWRRRARGPREVPGLGDLARGLGQGG